MSQGDRECQCNGRQVHRDYIRKDSRRKGVSVVDTKVLKGQSIDDFMYPVNQG